MLWGGGWVSGEQQLTADVKDGLRGPVSVHQSPCSVNVHEQNGMMKGRRRVPC